MLQAPAAESRLMVQAPAAESRLMVQAPAAESRSMVQTPGRRTSEHNLTRIAAQFLAGLSQG